MNYPIASPLLALQANLKRLLAIRLIVFSCQLLALLYAQLALGLALNYLALWAVLLSFLCLNVLLLLRLKHPRWPVSEQEFLVHLLMDVLVLSLLVYFSGGAANPFVSYLLVPVTIAAATLKWQHTTAVTLVSLASYSLLLFVYIPLPALQPDVALDTAHAHGHEALPMPSGINLHIIGMWLNFLVSAALITWFVVRMASEIREQQRQLATWREASLRDEQILAIATQAAGTAHELGTPLATMQVILKDLCEEQAETGFKEDLVILQRQVNYCRRVLKDLVKRAELGTREVWEEYSLGTFLDGLLEQWQLLRPEVSLNAQLALPDGGPKVRVDPALQQALFNLLDNAADVSEAGVTLRVWLGEEQWHLQIRDHGPGLTQEVRQRLGSGLYSSKTEGLGMGFLLSHATINRLGGTVRLADHPEGGTLSTVLLPLQGGKDA